MQSLGQTGSASGIRPALAACVDPSVIITELGSVKEARALPTGSVVGDLHGGLSFSDAVAAALESRSEGGWQEVHGPDRSTWTIILLDR